MTTFGPIIGQIFWNILNICGPIYPNIAPNNRRQTRGRLRKHPWPQLSRGLWGEGSHERGRLVGWWLVGKWATWRMDFRGNCMRVQTRVEGYERAGS